ncbi:MAG: AI-2E family transporter [Halobacteriales archaeon]
MRSSRRIALAAVLVAVAAINAVILRRMLATLFFAVTVAYVLVPLSSWLRRRGYSRWLAGAVSTAVAALGALALVAPLVAVLYLRRGRIVAALRAVPERAAIEVAGISYAVETRELVEPATRYLARAAISVAGATPVIAAKAIVFLFVVFAILIRREELSRALLAPLPDAYREIAVELHGRVRQTLFALYVTQAATGLGTFLVALPVFAVFGFDGAFTLALVAGILQFLPVVGPSVVVLALVAFEVTRGAVLAGGALLVVGLVLIAFLPDAVLRPALARRTADLPASLYFVGFTGGVLALGAVGIIAGPLAIALLVEVVSLLGDAAHDDAAGES